MIKQNKWYNFGDINHRIHGGNFVKIDGDEIEVVHTVNNEESGWMNGKGYTFGARTESVEELTQRFEAFKNGAQDCCGIFADWTMFINNCFNMDEIVMHMASDMLNYYGCDSEPEFTTNYWEALGSWGIKPYMF